MIIPEVSAVVAIMAAAHVFQLQHRLKKMMVFAQLQRQLVDNLRIAYATHFPTSPLSDDQAITLRTLQAIENLSTSIRRRDFNQLQAAQLHAALKVRDEVLRNVLLLRLAEICIDFGNVDIARTALSHITDERVIANSKQIEEMEQRRVVRESLKSFGQTEGQVAETISDLDAKISSLEVRRRQTQAPAR
ncbi:MAG: hypothetical protein KGO53_14310 [Alphaproteobacteria bacterium]|nr:hypothetical protein [Alphaproteobacteria bacterium]